jgi:hypothetical protein
VKPNTLRYHLTRPVFQKQPALISSAKGVQSAMENSPPGNLANPDADAFRFYLTNHFLADMQLRHHLDHPLTWEETEAVHEAVTTLNTMARRLFHYLILICTRETRHASSGPELIDILQNADGEFATFFNEIHHTSSSKAENHFRKHAPNIPMTNYTTHLVDLFTDPSYSGGYGGPAWAEIAKCLRDFVHGVISAETMVDIGWSLSHNNGPIFNKGMYYDMYSHELIRVLDIQRAGQIPHAIRDYRIWGFSVNPETGSGPVQQMYDTYANFVGWNELPSFIDWHAVVAAGAIKGVPKSYFAAQEQKMLTPAELALKEADALAFAKIQAEKEVLKAAAWNHNNYVVNNKLNVKKVHLNRGVS